MKPITPTMQKRIVTNILAACKDITKLNKDGYNFIYLAAGFIAHYDLHEFIDYYEDGSLQDDIRANRSLNM